MAYIQCYLSLYSSFYSCVPILYLPYFVSLLFDSRLFLESKSVFIACAHTRGVRHNPLYKLRSSPADFIVEEILPNGIIRESGGYAVYRLKKEGIDTFGAIRICAKHLGVNARDVGYCGLKDRHATTIQYISVPVEKTRGVPLEVADRNLSFELAGYLEKPLELGLHEGNRFEITLRELDQKAFDLLGFGVNALCVFPYVPNYFDSQRFGAIRATGGFVAADILKGDYASALRSLLTEYHRKDRREVKEVKRFLADHWGDWALCEKFLSGKKARSAGALGVMRTLAAGGDFLSALDKFDREELLMNLLAFQSFLWNEYLKRALKETFGKKRLRRVEYAAGELYFPFDGGDVKPLEPLLEVSAYLPSMPHFPVTDTPEGRFYEEKLCAMGFTGLSSFAAFERIGIKVGDARRPLFTKVSELCITKSGKDAQSGRGEKSGARMQERRGEKVMWAAQETQDIKMINAVQSPVRPSHFATLSFTLPPGAYATNVIKAVLG